jgi:hypothetical protein
MTAALRRAACAGVTLELRESAARRLHRCGSQVRSSVGELQRRVGDGLQVTRAIASQNAGISQTGKQVANRREVRGRMPLRSSEQHLYCTTLQISPDEVLSLARICCNGKTVPNSFDIKVVTEAPRQHSICRWKVDSRPCRGGSCFKRQGPRLRYVRYLFAPRRSVVNQAGQEGGAA